MKKKEVKRLFELLDANSNKKISVYEKQLIKNYKSSLEYVRTELQKLFNKLGGTPQYAEASIRLNNLESQITDNINKLTKKSNKIISTSITDTYHFNYNATNQIISNATDSAITLGLISKKSTEASVINPFSWESSNIKYSQKLLTGIKNSVSIGLISGKSYPNILKDVTNKFDIASNSAMRIIKTETHRAESASRIDSIENAQDIGERLGYTVEKVWSSFIDERTRQSHIDLDGTVADDNGMFNVGGILCEGPGMSGDPAEDINCRCSLIIEIKDSKM